MRIDSFSKYNEHGPSSRFRLYQFVDLFSEAGIEFRIHPLFDEHYLEILRTGSGIVRNLRKTAYVPHRFRKRVSELSRVSAKLVHIEQQLFPYLPFLVEKQFLPERYLIEFDDAIYLTHPAKFPEILKRAEGVIAGNQFLAEYASRYNSIVHMIPTVLNVSRFRPSERARDNKTVTLGWSGLEYNFKYLKLIESALLRLTQNFDVRVIILSGTPPLNLGFPFLFRRWSPELEVEQIDEFDIGLMPLASDEWCRGKCGFKLLQYMSLKIPSVASPVGVNQEIVTPGENGFTAETEDDWYSRISDLVRDEGLRISIGNAARDTVVRRFSTDVWFPKLLSAYRNHERASS